MLVFISYHTPDREKAQAIEMAVAARRPGDKCYLAPRSILGGAYWVPDLADAIGRADAVLFLAGRRIGPWQELEYYEALRLSREGAGRPKLIPVVIADQAPGLPFFAQLQQIFGSDPAAPEIIAAIGRALDNTLAREASPAWRHFQPYKGLPALEEADAAFFFGRDGETAGTLELMARQPDRIIALIGQSGVGKSSLARAGVLARLKSQTWPAPSGAWPTSLRDSRAFLPLVIRPGERPLKELALAFAQLYSTRSFELDEEAEGWARRFAEGAALRDMLRATRDKLAAALDADPPKRFVVYLDQGEEIYTRAGPEEARRFSSLIAESAGSESFSVMMSLRSDYYRAYQTDRAIFDASETVDVLPLTGEVLGEIVRKPALTLGARFESDDMAARVADATEREPGALPLLSDLMHEMWLNMQARGDGVLRWSDNPEIVDVAAPLRRRAEAFLAGSANDEAVARRLFTLRLAHVPEVGDPVPRRARRGECSAAEWAMAEQLAAQEWRLLTGSRTADDEPIVEVAHEQLLRRWPLLKTWLDEESGFLVWKGRVDQDAAEYAALPEADRAGALLMGRRLANARGWFERRAADLAPDTHNFVAASLAADTARHWRQRKMRVGLSAGFAITLALGGLSGWQWHEAGTKERIEKFYAQLIGLPSQQAPAAARVPSAPPTILPLRGTANIAEGPVIDAVVDHDSGARLWSSANPTSSAALKPGQEILLKGHNFGPGPITAARPGLGPPAGGVPSAGGTSSVASSPPESANKELSKVLFGNVRAFERNLSSYPARIDLQAGAASLFAQLQGKVLDYFVEQYQPVPDTWAGDIYAWSDTEIDLTVPITAYEGPIQVVRIPLTGGYVLDIRTGAPLRYRDPNTARVVEKDKYVFVDGWQIARTDAAVLASNTVPVGIAQSGADRLQYGAPLVAGTSEGDARETRQALQSAATGQLRKTRPTMRSAADQYADGEKAYWAWDWNLALPHLLLGVDWDGIFGFRYDQKDPFIEMLVQTWKYKASGIARPAIELKGYQFPEFNGDGTVGQMRLHKAMIDRSTGEGIRPFTSFGAIPLLPEAGAERLVAPPVAFNSQTFDGPTPYPIEMALHLPFLEPLSGGQTNPTGWAGYVYAEAANPIPGQGKTGQWIGFSCAGCHAARVTFEYKPGEKRVSRIFNGIPNPDWKATFLTLSGRTYGLALEEELPLNFIRFDHPAGTQKRLESQRGARGLRFLDALSLINGQRVAGDMRLLSKEPIDKTLLIYSMPPGATESTLFVPSDDPGDYANDYFFSPQVMPIITNHTPVRRALSRSELIDGFEGAYLHGEEPEGARGPMSSRSVQDLTLYTSTLHQEDELLRRIGMYRWLAYKGLSALLGDVGGRVANEGTFVSLDYPADSLTRPASFPPLPVPSSGLGTVRDAAIAETSAERALTEPFAHQYPNLAGRLFHGAQLFKESCARCHSSGNAGLWTNEDMHPISAAGGSEPTGRFFSPTVWQRRTQSIRTAILENLFWVQQRGLLSDGHVVGSAPDNMDGLDLLVRPDRCQAPLNADGSVDLARASDLYKRLYTIRQGTDHSFRIPSAGMRFELYTRFGQRPGVAQQTLAPKPDRLVTEPEGRFVERHAYFTKLDDGYYYWDYQKMRREYGILEFGLDPKDPQNASRIGGMPGAPHPWCLPAGSTQTDINDLVIFLLTL